MSFHDDRICIKFSILLLCCTMKLSYGKWGPWYSWLGLPSWPLRQPVCRLHTVTVRQAALVSDESALKACTWSRWCAIQIDNLYLLPLRCYLCCSVGWITESQLWSKLTHQNLCFVSLSSSTLQIQSCLRKNWPGYCLSSYGQIAVVVSKEIRFNIPWNALYVISETVLWV